MSRTKLIPFLLVIFPLLLVLPISLLFLQFSQAPKKSMGQQEILYQEDFNQGATDWDYLHPSFNPPPGTWEWVGSGGVTGGAYHHQYPSSGTWGHDNFAYLKNKNFTDFSYEADIKILAGNAGIQGRVTVDNPNASLPVLGGYRCDLLQGNKIKIQRYRLIQPSGQIGDHRNPLDLKVADFSWQSGQWYKLKMEIEGNTIRCFVDGSLKLEYTDTNSLSEYEIQQGKTQNGAIFKNGTIGFFTYSANAYWDNLVVKPIGAGGPTATPGGEKKVWAEWKQDDWMGSWKWQGNQRIATQPEQDSLIIHFKDKPFEVIFWDGRDGGTKMPHWRPVGSSNYGVCPGWFESGDSPDWEVLFSDRSLIDLKVLEERNDYVKVRWWYKPTKDRQGSFGGTGFEVHRGNTEVEQIFEFFSNGLTQVTMNIKLGNQNFANQSGTDMELGEWNFLFPLGKTPVEILGRDNKIVRVMDPYSTAETAMNLTGQGLDKNLANGWNGQIHLVYHKDPKADFFVIWGKKVQPGPPDFPDFYQKIVKLYYQEAGVNMTWPKPSCNASAPLMTKAYMPNANYVANLTYQWLVGMGETQNLDLRKIAYDWLEYGKIDETGPTTTPGPGSQVLYFKTKFEGFSFGNQPKMLTTIKVSGLNFSQTLVLPENGESPGIEIPITAGRSYDFLLSAPGFLTAKKSLSINSGRNPASGFLDFGTLKSGDLNDDNQINGLDWSWMKLNYGENGEE